MQHIADLVREAEANNVILHVKDGKLSYMAEQGGFPVELKTRVISRKQEIVDFLLTREIDRSRSENGVQIVAADRSQPLPLSFAQQRLWIVDQLEAGSSQYNLPLVLRAQGPLDRHALQLSIDSIVRRHEVLRTRFGVYGDAPRQLVQPAQPVPIQIVDLSQELPAARETRVGELAAAEAARPFDLAHDLMLRVSLLVLGGDDHVLLFTQHHIASDGWSVSLLAREFAALYSAYCRAGSDPLPPLPIQYVDYSVWQRERFAGQGLQRELDYWRRQLDGLPPVHGLPLDRPRPPRKSSRGGVVRQSLDRELLGGLKRLCQSENVTLFVMLQTAFALLVSRCSFETDVAIGTPTSGRSHPQVESLIGFFVDNLVLRSRFDHNLTFRAALAQNRQTILDAFSHQSMPFDLLVEHLNPQRSLSYDPLIQIVFGLNNNESQALDIGALRLIPLQQDSVLAKVDLELAAIERNDALDISWIYRSDLFEADAMAALAQDYECLLQSIVADPARGIFDYPLLTSARRERVLQLGHGPAHERSEPDIAFLFAQAAARTPDATAVCWAGGALNYAQLSVKVQRLADYLRSLGVDRESRVGVYLPRSPEMLIGVLAVMKAGAAYVPLEPGLPVDRIAYMVGDAAIQWVLLQSDRLGDLPAGGVDFVLMDDAVADASWLQEFAAGSLPAVASQPEDLLYVLYTSGSTGRPKGVMITRSNAANYLAHCVDSYLTPQIAGAVVSSPLCFDATLTTLLPALLCGKPVLLLPDDESTLECLLQRLFADEGDWLFKITPAHLDALAHLPRPAGSGGSAHRIVVGGDQLTTDTLRMWKNKLLPNAFFYNEYGPTEATVGCSVHEIASGDDLAALGGAAAVPVGLPIRNVQLYVLGPSQMLQPIGSYGELYIGGDGLARGYLNRSELTEQCFIDNPFGTGRLYRTGDIVRWCAAGHLEFLGRRDDQIKIRGFRIELGEVEAQLRRLDLVQDAHVLARSACQGAPVQLVAYVVASDPNLDAGLLVQQCRRGLTDALPDYMVPSFIVPLTGLPLTANGKVDRRRLPEPSHADSASALDEAPRTAREQTLYAIWCELLQRQSFGVHDNFFALGGDSILAIQMVSRANRAGLALNTRLVFAHQTIAGLAVHGGGVAAQAQQQPVEGGLALLPVQRALLEGGGDALSHFNQSLLLTVPEGFDGVALTALVRALYERHDALRLRFHCDGTGWQATHVPLSDALVDASCIVESVPAAGASAKAFIQQRSELHQGTLDIGAGQLLRAVLFDAGAQSRLLLVVHHLVMDGVSWHIVLADLERSYLDWNAGKPVQPAPKTSSYQAWGEAVNAHLAAPRCARELEYWHAQLEPRTEPLQAERRARQRADIASSRRVTVHLNPSETTALLLDCDATYRTTINELLLAALYWALRQWSKRSRLRIDVESHGREHLSDALDTSETVGWFTTIHPLVLQAAGDEIGTIIKAVKEQSRGVPRHGFSYGVLRYIARDEKLVAADAEQPASLLFNYLGQIDSLRDHGTHFRVSDEAVGNLVDPARLRTHLLGINGLVIDGSLRFDIDYSSAQFNEATVRNLASAFEAGLRRVIQHCTKLAWGEYTPSDFPLACVDQPLLDDWQRRYAIESLYRSTPMQQGMLFHSLIDPGAYVTQIFPTFSGPLDSGCLRRAWRLLLARHAIFRTAFVGEGDRQHQLVCLEARLPWTEIDWRKLDPHQQEQAFERLCAEDRSAGYDPLQSPLMRVTLLRLGDARHRMLWSHHHSLLDGWSMALVLRDLMLAYGALARGMEPDFPVTAPYRSYVEWLQAQDVAQARRYWREYLSPMSAPTPLPTDRSDRTIVHATLSLQLGSTDTMLLRQLASRHKTTLNTLIQLAWGLLLARRSGENTVMFGAVIAGRPPEVAHIEGMVGLFINSIPVVASFVPGKPLEQQIAALQAGFQASSSYAYLPLVDIQREAGIAAGSSLFDSLLVFENYPLDAALSNNGNSVTGALRVESVGSSIRDTYPIALGITEGETLNVVCNYFGHLFSARRMGELLDELQYVLQQLPRSDSTATIALVRPAQARELLAVESAALYPLQCIHTQFELQAARTPSAIAVQFGAQQLSYRELNRRANRLACYLVDAGVGVESRVGIYLQRSIEMLVAVLGVLKAGGTYVPLEPGLPAGRIAYLLEDAGIAWVLLDSASMERLPLGGVDVVLMDGAADDADWLVEFDDGRDLVERVAVAPDNLAYVLYTSGSTGQPKGVMIAHRAVSNYLAHAVRAYVDADIEGAVVSSPLCFDATLTTLLPPLLVGKPVLLLPDDGTTLAALAAALFQSQRCWLFKITPAHLEALLHMDLPATAGTAAHRVVIGGEQLPAATLRRWKRDLLPNARFVNEYGPTETVVGCSTFRVDTSSQLQALEMMTAVPVGQPIQNTQLYILSDEQQLQPRDCIGELYIGGAGLARGYLNRAALTAERFVANPFGTGLLYRTGDLARWLPDGELAFVGRRDDQVKIRGFRIELGEIESGLRAIGAVRDACVLARSDTPTGDKRLVAYVVAASATDASSMTATCREALARRLPDYMVPTAFVVLDALPLTA
ncbi:MAG: amino acid adenylation domain-containing protein, partial [Rhodanobacteraceae bacterium]|nr:amino acid adenylation domain-containing protein [Rhodanobacteraceae bacterium]